MIILLCPEILGDRGLHKNTSKIGYHTGDSAESIISICGTIQDPRAHTFRIPIQPARPDIRFGPTGSSVRCGAAVKSRWRRGIKRGICPRDLADSKCLGRPLLQSDGDSVLWRVRKSHVAECGWEAAPQERLPDHGRFLCDAHAIPSKSPMDGLNFDMALHRHSPVLFTDTVMSNAVGTLQVRGSKVLRPH